MRLKLRKPQMYFEILKWLIAAASLAGVVLNIRTRKDAQKSLF